MYVHWCWGSICHQVFTLPRYIVLFKWPYTNAPLLSYEIIHMPTFISPISPAFFFCDFLHVCLSNNLITVFIKSHSYTYLIKNLSFNERSYLLIWKKTIRLKKVWLQCVLILQSRKLRVLQIFVHKCLAVILEVLVLEYRNLKKIF